MIRRVALFVLACCPSLTAQAAPTTVSLSPPHGATDVDPATTELVVRFDRAMDQTCGWSVCGGGPTFPKVDRIGWRDARTLVIRAELLPGVRYQMPLNCQSSSQRLRSTDGVRLAPTPWSFETRDDRVADLAQRERNAGATDALRALLETEYSYRDRVVDDWDTAFDARRDALLAAPTDSAWSTRAARLLGAAQDPHLWIGADREHGATFAAPPPANYDLRTIGRVVPDLQQPNDTVWYGTLDDPDLGKVGYLLIHSLSNPRQAELFACQDIVDELASECDAIVLDLRPNGGGNEVLALPIAAWFVDGRKVYAGHVRKDPKTGAWDDYQERVVTGNASSRRFAGPVAVLIGPHCVSSCEAFVLMMKQARRAVLVGARTRGSSGNPLPHDLGNGITVWLPSWRATDAAGVPFEGVGIAPDVQIATEPADFGERDPVLDRALVELRRL